MVNIATRHVRRRKRERRERYWSRVGRLVGKVDVNGELEGRLLKSL
jgi:hypothetical protein